MCLDCYCAGRHETCRRPEVAGNPHSPPLRLQGGGVWSIH